MVCCFARPDPGGGVSGGGVGCVPDFVARDSLSAGRVIQLLPEWAFDTNYQGMAYLLFAGTRCTTPKIRVLIDHVVSELRPKMQPQSLIGMAEPDR